MEVILDGLELRNMEELHDRFAPLFPPFYGRNLDALFDCLTEPGEPIAVTIRHRETLIERLGRGGRALEELLHRAAAENPRLTVTAD